MAVPVITALKLWVGTLFTKDDWDFNFRQIVSWLGDGNSDLVVNSIKATNGIDLDGATIKNVGAAQTGSEAVNLDQATTLLNRSSFYYPFSVASGKVNSSTGEAAFLQKDNDTQVTVLAGNTNPDLVCVSSDGTIESVTSNVVLTVSTTDGTYHIVKEKGQTITITGASVSYGIAPHTTLSPSIGDYYCETSSVPFKGWKYTADGWEETEFCYLGYVTVSSNVATVTTFNYNNNEYNVLIKEKYINGTEGYIVYTDNYCVQWGNIADANPAVTVNFLKEFADDTYNVCLGGKGKASSSAYYVLEATDRTAASMKVNYRWDSVDWRCYC